MIAFETGDDKVDKYKVEWSYNSTFSTFMYAIISEISYLITLLKVGEIYFICVYT